MFAENCQSMFEWNGTCLSLLCVNVISMHLSYNILSVEFDLVSTASSNLRWAGCFPMWLLVCHQLIFATWMAWRRWMTRWGKSQWRDSLPFCTILWCLACKLHKLWKILLKRDQKGKIWCLFFWGDGSETIAQLLGRTSCRASWWEWPIRSQPGCRYRCGRVENVFGLKILNLVEIPWAPSSWKCFQLYQCLEAWSTRRIMVFQRLFSAQKMECIGSTCCLPIRWPRWSVVLMASHFCFRIIVFFFNIFFDMKLFLSCLWTTPQVGVLLSWK